jgi:hypothetical protein
MPQNAARKPWREPFCRASKTVGPGIAIIAALIMTNRNKVARDMTGS